MGEGRRDVANSVDECMNSTDLKPCRGAIHESSNDFLLIKHFLDQHESIT